MGHSGIEMLERAIHDYLQWMKSMEYRRSSTRKRYARILGEFLIYVRSKKIVWKDMFTLDTLKAFRKYTNVNNPSHGLIGLSGYLFRNGRIPHPQPLQIPNYQVDLPDIYEHYLLYYEQSRQTPYARVKPVRRVLVSFHDYLQRHKIKLSALKIEHLDAFLAQFNKPFSPGTQRLYRSHLRGFLNYLYHERKIIRTDLAPLVVGAPLFAQVKPPKFLRPQQVQKLFASLKLATPNSIRTYAMVHLAYTLGLRPVEITRITLDDISFSKGELTLRDRKGKNPITLPISEHTVKAMAAYVLKARPKSPYRHLLLSFHFPHRPISSGTVVGYLSGIMKQAGLSSSGYWLRHTYAQNLLEIGQSIYEIKEMLGHQNIQSTQRYLHIHTELMRKVLFNETP